MKKRFALLAVTGLMIVGLAACGGQTTAGNTGADAAKQTQDTAKQTEEAAKKAEDAAKDASKKVEETADKAKDTASAAQDEAAKKKAEAEKAKQEAAKAAEDTKQDAEAKAELSTEQIREIAKSYVGKTVDSLKEEIGEPDSTDISDGCSDGGEDGIYDWGEVEVISHAKPDGEHIIQEVN